VNSGIMGIAAWAMLNDWLSGGASIMLVLSILGGRVLAPLIGIVTESGPIANARAAWQRLSQLLSVVPKLEPVVALPPPVGRLQVEGLFAGAPGSPSAILRGISFALSPGEVLAVIGPSASGKSTLARLLVGVWPSVGGKVRLDGADVYDWRKTELGPYLGYLPQDVELFDGTIADNIARFSTADPEHTRAAARIAGIHDFIHSLPQGYDSPVGQSGVLLSGGQRQRVGLARALYGNPVLVVLDEPNSSLDEAGDAALTHAIQTLKAQGTTFVVITHRTSLLPVTDKLLMLRDGQVQAFGPRDDVLAALNEANGDPRVEPVIASKANNPKPAQQAVNP
jgi:ATP-binding cassette, subfamily C, bacterial exporter for protease/lipase